VHFNRGVGKRGDGHTTTRVHFNRGVRGGVTAAKRARCATMGKGGLVG
jgi:hypothetical protein